MSRELTIVDESKIKNNIHTICGLQVMLDRDLAELYEVSTKVLNQAVKRNIERFPQNFMFQLNEKEHDFLRSQIVTSNKEDLRFQIGTSKSNRGGRRYLPFAFTEQGVAMLSGVLKSETAVRISIQIMNAFVSMRKFLLNNAQVFQRIDTVEKKQIEYKIETDEKFNKILLTIGETFRLWFARHLIKFCLFFGFFFICASICYNGTNIDARKSFRILFANLCRHRVKFSNFYPFWLYLCHK